MRHLVALILLYYHLPYYNKVEAAIYDLLNYGLPTHSLGYADENGFVLYSKHIGDLFLLPLSKDKIVSNLKIPIRVVFSTAPEQKGLLFQKFWTISIYDSYVIKCRRNEYKWVTPDLNTVILKKYNNNDVYVSEDGNVLLYKKGKNVTICSSDSRIPPISLLYTNGILDKITIKINNKLKSFHIFRNKFYLSIREDNQKEIFRINNCNISYPNKKIQNYFCIDIKTKSFPLHNNLQSSSIELPVSLSYGNIVQNFDYSLNTPNSKFTFDLRKYIQWDYNSGLITSDWISNYSIEELKNSNTVITRILPWDIYKYTIAKKTAITRMSSKDIAVESHRIIGIPSLFGKFRKHTIYKKSTELNHVQYIYNPNGKIIKTINKRR